MGTPATTNTVYITYVEKYGAFLKIWGQVDRNYPVIIEKSLMDLKGQFDQGLFAPSLDSLQIGLFCCAKYKDELYYRARVTNISMLSQNLVEVHFIDYGNKELLLISNLRSIVNFAPGLLTIPPQARDFILANVTHIGLSWDSNTVALVSNEIRYIELQFIVVQQVNPFITLIKLYKNGEDFALSLFNRGLVLSMASVSQNMILQNTNSATTPSLFVQPSVTTQPTTPTVELPLPTGPPTPALLSYKAVTIEPDTENNIYVSYVSDGPCQFSVQLQKLEDNLARLMRELNRMALQPLEEDPLPGTVCVAKCLEDDHICRAVVTSMVDGQYKVFYVDFGNSEVVPLTHLYQIPFKYVILKVMAMRYALAGLERSSVTLEMKCAFKEFVSDKLLRMRSLPSPTRSGLPLCSLWDSNNVNVLDVLKKAALLAYPEVTPLTRGFCQEVLVSYVYSCSHFYVQLKAKEEELRNVMAELQVHCPSADKVQLSKVKIGLPCCALFDDQWYRAQILSNENDIIKVRYVDYGNEELVQINNLRMPIGNLLTALRPQALECCLNGYQNMEDDIERDNILEELILEKEFTMRVIEMQSSRALVDLIDNARYNVGSLLLEKLASARSQVSPLLIQENYQIEQRKRQSPNKFERKNSRDSDKGWSRQNSSDKGLSPKESFDKQSYQKYSNRGFTKKDLNNRFNQDFKDRTISRQDFNKTQVFTNNNAQDDEWSENNQSSPTSNEWRSDKKQESWRQDRPPRKDRDADDGGLWKNDRFPRKDRDGGAGGWNNDRPIRKERDGDGGGWNNDRPPRKDRDGGGWNSDRPPRKDRDGDGGGWNSDRPPRKERDADSGGWGNDRSPRKDGDGGGWNNDRPPRRDKGGGGWNSERPPRKNRDTEDGGWGTDSSPRKDDNDAWNNDKVKKDGSEKSFEGTEKNWRRNQRGTENKPFTRNDFKSKEFSRATLKTVEDPADITQLYTYTDFIGRCEEVTISWFHNPANFYCQLKASEIEFRSLVEDIQNWYCKITPVSLPVGAPAIALFPEDGVLYRAYISEMKGSQYYVHFVDFGNFSTTDKVWPIEKKFMVLPAQGIFCSLNGLIPIDENGVWPNVELFASYFDKDSFTCSFIANENNCYFVELTSGDVSINESLVSAGVAQYVEFGECANYDPSILCGQQIHVTLSDVKSLDFFTVILQNGIQLTCTLHNLENATNTFEDTLKMYLGTVIIMYVDNVLEEKTEITLYDITGAKITVIEPDEGAYESVEPICPLPVLNSTINGWVSFVNASEKKLFIQLSEYSETVTQLLDELFNHYDTTLEEPLQPEIGSYYAVHSPDENWYRGIVLGVEEENVTLLYVDYGNAETVSNIELRELTPKFKQYHMLALEVTSSNIDESLVGQEVTATVWYGESGWEAEVHIADKTAVPVEEAISSNIEPAEVTEVEQLELLEEFKDVGVPVCLSHIDSPNQFYLQLQEAVETIRNLQATLQEQVETYPDLENPAAGDLCATQYSIDQQWYRAQVLDADGEITSVRFVDCGNTDVIKSHIKTLPSDMLALEQYARRCSLLIKPLNDEEWDATTSERFEALTQCEVLSVEIIHQDEKTTYVDLYADGQKVSDILLQEGLATKLELEVESSCTGYVSNLNSPSEFWIQLENSVADLEWVAEQLSSASNFAELEDVTPGSLCAALYTDDEMWYRARILSNTVAGIEVLFIDYGNSCTCTGLRQLPEDLIMLPALAQKCSLLKPQGVLQWSLQATEEFKNISADGATVFNIEKLSTGETLIVRLLLESKDISVNLLPITEGAYITYINSINCFWMQKVTEQAKSEEIAGKLANASEFSTCEKVGVGDIVAALHDDNLWYRACILTINENEYEVLFIDYGNTSVTNEIRTLNEEDKFPPLANRYKMEPVPGFRWIEEDATQKLSEISNEGSTIFEAEFASEDVVRLYLNGSDIRADMDAACISSVQSSPKKNTVTSISESNKIMSTLEMSDENLHINTEVDNGDDATNYYALNSEIENINDTVDEVKNLENNVKVLEISENTTDDHKANVSNDQSHPPLVRRSSTPHCERIVPGSVCRGDLTEVDAQTEVHGAGSPETRSSTPECDKSEVVESLPPETGKEGVVTSESDNTCSKAENVGDKMNVNERNTEQNKTDTVTASEQQPPCDNIVPGIDSTHQTEENDSSNEILKVHEIQECNKADQVVNDKSETDDKIIEKHIDTFSETDTNNSEIAEPTNKDC